MNLQSQSSIMGEAEKLFEQPSAPSNELDWSSPVPDKDSTTRLIPLSRGMFVIVDASDYVWLTSWKWYATEKRGKWTAVRTERKSGIKTTIQMARTILAAEPHVDITYADGDTLNCTRTNIAVVPVRQQIVQPEDVSIRHIPLTSGKLAIVDVADYDFLMQWKWHAQFKPSGARWYAGCIPTGQKRTVLMHRLLLNASHGIQVDHKDGDGLNNRRSNIRLATNAENLRNCGPSKNNSSGAKGVSWSTANSKWQARITVNRVSMYLGYFTEKSNAIAAYAEAAKKYHGEFARTEPFKRKEVRGGKVATPMEATAK